MMKNLILQPERRWDGRGMDSRDIRGGKYTGLGNWLYLVPWR